MHSEVEIREATSADVPSMTECRAADVAAGPADARMGAYLEGKHHPQKALMERTGYVATAAGAVIGYAAGHRTTRFDCNGELQYSSVKSGVETTGRGGGFGSRDGKLVSHPRSGAGLCERG